MAAYVIGEIEVTDPATYEDYRKQVVATIEKFGGRFVVRGGRPRRSKARRPSASWCSSFPAWSRRRTGTARPNTRRSSSCARKPRAAG